MASKDAMELGGKTKDGIIPEGVSTVVKSVGPALKVYSDLIAGIRQGMGLVGARNIVELREKALFQLVSQRTKVF
jgi:IMP dehydrogenase